MSDRLQPIEAGAPSYHRVDPMQAGPSLSLPAVRMAGAIAAGAILTGLVAWPIVHFGRPGTDPAIVRGALGVAGAFAISLAILRPWRIMPVGRWLMAWLVGLGVRFVATVAAAGLLLYFSPPSERLTLGLVIAAGHFVVLLAESAVVASHLKSRCGPLRNSPAS